MQSTLLTVIASLNWTLVTTSYSTELILNTYLLILSYQDLLIDLSEVYGVMVFIFILISSANTTNILIMELPQNPVSNVPSSPNKITPKSNTNLNYKSVNYRVWKYTKTSPGLLNLCETKSTLFR